MKQEIETITAMILQLVEQDRDIKDQFVLLQSLPGISKIAAVTLLVDCPELGEIATVKVSALIALAHKILRIGSPKEKTNVEPQSSRPPT